MKVVTHTDETIVTGLIDDNPSDYKWVVYVGRDPQEFDEWDPAFDEFIDSLRFWMGYWSVQVEDAEEKKLTWTVDLFHARVKDYERWIKHLESIRHAPQMVSFLGAEQKLSITPIRKQDNDA